MREKPNFWGSLREYVYTCVGKVSNFKQFRTLLREFEIERKKREKIGISSRISFLSFFYSSHIINIIHTLLVYMKMSQSSDENNASVYDKVYCT